VLILVIGGARSGKSAVAEQLVGQLPQPVTYLATLASNDIDDDLARRIAAHRSRRPVSWHTEDAQPGLAAQMRALTGTVLLDSLGPWVAMHRPDAAAVEDLRAALDTRVGDTVVVSDEVGLSVHPTTKAGLAFRDDLGDVNAAVAAAAQHTLFVVAGRILSTTAFDAAVFADGAF
jgi:adenosyl cobinamide kinase/adenosyl cobinamide phosphate guanylyltransferase